MIKKILLILFCLPLLFSCGEEKVYWHATLELMVADVVKELSNNSKDSVFNAAIANALKAQEDSQDNFIILFGDEYEKLSPSNGLAVLFISQLKGKYRFKINASNQEVITVLKVEVEDAISQSLNVLRTRIDRFGVKEPGIQRIEGTAKILVELSVIKDPERLRKLLQSTGNVEFWETYEYTELFQGLESANTYLRENTEVDTTGKEVITETRSEAAEGATDLLAELESYLIADSMDDVRSFEEFATENPLYALLYPNVDQTTGQLNAGPVVGFCQVKDTSALNVYLKDDAIRKFLPVDVKFAYTIKPSDEDGKFVQLIALKRTNRDGKAAMEGDVVMDASDQINTTNTWEVSMTMNTEGAKQWKRLTANNINKSVAIVLDGYVYSFPTVQAEIAGGRSSITGSFTSNEAKDLANILKSGKLPAPVRIIEEEIINPLLVEE